MPSSHFQNNFFAQILAPPIVSLHSFQHRLFDSNKMFHVIEITCNSESLLHGAVHIQNNIFFFVSVSVSSVIVEIHKFKWKKIKIKTNENAPAAPNASTLHLMAMVNQNNLQCPHCHRQHSNEYKDYVLLHPRKWTKEMIASGWLWQHNRIQCLHIKCRCSTLPASRHTSSDKLSGNRTLQTQSSTNSSPSANGLHSLCSLAEWLKCCCDCHDFCYFLHWWMGRYTQTSLRYTVEVMREPMSSQTTMCTILRFVADVNKKRQKKTPVKWWTRQYE